MTKITKSDFIRARADKTAAEIVADATAQGIVMTANYVYVVRGNDKGHANTVTKPTPQKASGKAPQVITVAKAEQAMEALIAYCGVARSQELVAQAAAKIQGRINQLNSALGLPAD